MTIAMNRYLPIVLLLCSSVLADEPAALYIFPAGGQRGQNDDITAVTVRRTDA